MKNSRALFAIICLAAAIGILTAACDDGNDGDKNGDPPLTGSISIMVGGEAVASSLVNQELTAHYDGTETITAYQWKRGGSNVGANSGKFTPEQAGSYTVTVSAEGFKDKTSAAVNVTLTPPGNGTEASPYQLAHNMWASGEISNKDGEVWYSFPVTEGTRYRIWWNDKKQGDGTKTGDIAVAAKYKTINYFTFGSSGSSTTVDNGWNSAQLITGLEDDTILLRVVPYDRSENNTGTYSIVYSTGYYRPGLAIPLTGNIWADGEITGTTPDYEHWYSFDVTEGETYHVWWNKRGASYDGDGTKTGNIAVMAYNQNGSTIFGNYGSSYDTVDRAWNAPQTITATANGAVYLRVIASGRSSSSMGTYGIVYTTGPVRPSIEPFVAPSVAQALTANVWADGEIIDETGEDWYSFPVTAGTTYRVWWNDSKQGNSYKNGDVAVSAWHQNGTTLFGGMNNIVDSGWTTAQSFTAASNGTVYIRVIPLNRDNAGAGTYGVSYSAGTVRPWPVYTTLVADEWKDGEVTETSSQEWFSFPVTAGKTYRIWWNEKGASAGDSTKTGDVSGTAWFGDGTIIFDGIQTGWRNPQIYIPDLNGTVYLRFTTPYQSSSYYGTYAVAYNVNSRPRPGVMSDSLTAGVWSDSVVLAYNDNWYSFEATAGTEYRIWWNNRNEGDGTKYGEIVVSAWDDNGLLFGGTDSAERNGWVIPQIFTAASTCTIDIRVRPYYNNAHTNNDYAIAYDTGKIRPETIVDPLTDGKWVNGSFSRQGEDKWYSLDVIAGTEYNIWFNGRGASNNGDGSKTGDIVIYIWRDDGTIVFEENGYGNNWNVPLKYTAESTETMYIIAKPFWNYGTYGMAVSTETERPPL
ncbi:MAG: hypothetical protein FWG46_03240 [Treponema sp.]|nr:hypothetical protein [Treponema sp.]